MFHTLLYDVDPQSMIVLTNTDDSILDTLPYLTRPPHPFEFLKRTFIQSKLIEPKEIIDSTTPMCVVLNRPSYTLSSSKGLARHIAFLMIAGKANGSTRIYILEDRNSDLLPILTFYSECFYIHGQGADFALLDHKGIPVLKFTIGEDGRAVIYSAKRNI